MSEQTLAALLQPLKDRLERAEASRARSRTNPGPIFDAAMMLDIQASSSDVPKLIAAIEGVTTIHEPGPGYYTTDKACRACSNSIGYVPYPCFTVRAICAALTQALGGDTA